MNIGVCSSVDDAGVLTINMLSDPGGKHWSGEVLFSVSCDVQCHRDNLIIGSYKAHSIDLQVCRHTYHTRSLITVVKDMVIDNCPSD